MSEYHEFLNPTCKIRTLSICVIRGAILRALRANLGCFHGTVLDIGCGHMPYKPLLLAPPARGEKYIGMDLGLDLFAKPDLLWDGRHIPLEDNSVDSALATEVLEHCPEPEVVLKEAWRVLRPGGALFLTVPFLWPLHGVPYDEYRYTPFALRRHLENAGFEHIKLEALGGWNASLAQMLGLWAHFGVSSRVAKGVCSLLALPVIRFLLWRDRVPAELGPKDFVMITGIAGTARKPLPG
jgi:SAM-dependent methyltransferase